MFTWMKHMKKLSKSGAGEKNLFFSPKYYLFIFMWFHCLQFFISSVLTKFISWMVVSVQLPSLRSHFFCSIFALSRISKFLQTVILIQSRLRLYKSNIGEGIGTSLQIPSAHHHLFHSFCS